MNRSALLALMISMASVSASAATGDATGKAISFDLPPVAEAVPADSAAVNPVGGDSVSGDTRLVTIDLRLSAMIHSPTQARVDQWLIRCQPRDTSATIADYSPRTSTSSGLATPIQVKQTEEQNDVLGVSLSGTYAHAVNGSAGADHARKNIRTRQFDRLAPEQTVTAAGTINRGRGVYFKLRWTSQQVLEGEKTFQVTLNVPRQWRGCLIDVSVVAQSARKSLTPWDRDHETIAAADFVIAAYRRGDADARALAWGLAKAEAWLREVAQESKRRPVSLPGMLRSVAIKLDLESNPASEHWLRRLILDLADPHLDETIRHLPMPVRLAVLDYAEVRDEFNELTSR